MPGAPVSGSPDAAGCALRDMGILVTGGGSGIGLAVSRRLLEEGAAVMIVGRSAQRLEEARQTLRPSAPTLLTCRTRIHAGGPSKQPAICAAACAPSWRVRESPGARWPR
jgi:NAD(P)-dependent dehydrogenase (short-subunit alcohol dehydrogenase family)